MRDFLTHYKLYLLGIGVAIVGFTAMGIWFNTRFPTVDSPAQTWETSTPEEQGIDSAELAEGLLAMQQREIPIHSLMIEGSVISSYMPGIATTSIWTIPYWAGRLLRV